MFSPGDTLFYPAHGIGRVKCIRELSEGDGQSRTYYVLEIIDKKMQVHLPTENAEALGLRPVVSREELDSVFDILRDEADVGLSQWNKRYQMNNEKLKTGSIYETAEVVRDLTQRNRRKTLGTKEARMFDTAKQLLASEIAYILDISNEEALASIGAALEARRVAS